MALQQHLPGPAEPRDAHLRQPVDGVPLGFQKRVKRAAGGLLAGAVNKIHQVRDDHFRFGAAGHRRRQRDETAGRVTLHDRVKDGDGLRPPGPAKHLGDAVDRHPVGGHRRRLVEKRQRVADRSLGGAGDGGDRLGVGGDRLTLADRRDMCRQHIGRHASQVKALASRQDGDRHLADLGRGEDEFHIVGRFLKRLQKRVERALRHHVDLVDDIDLEPPGDWPVPDTLDNLAGIVDAGVACRVDLQNIDMAAGGDGPAWLADAAGLQRRAALTIRSDAVQAAGEKPRCRGLANTANAGQDEGMCQPAKRQRVFQRADKRFLPDQLGKSLGAIFAGEDPVTCQGAVVHDV